MTAPSTRSLTVLTFAVAINLAAFTHGDASDSQGTASIQKQVDAARKQQSEARKQVALKKASVDVQKQRAAELEKRLQEAKQAVAKETKAFEAAAMTEKSVTKQLAGLSATLKRHQYVDSLLANAAAVQKQVAKARATHKAMVDNAASMKQSFFVHQQ